jgi:hypothetical protein|tara:strand:+ start:3717 stop:4373 length:657 start_codon:yes stop_codon:yes gene_type:complete
MKNIERKLEIGDILTPYKFANTLSREANRGGDTFLAGCDELVKKVGPIGKDTGRKIELLGNNAISKWRSHQDLVSAHATKREYDYLTYQSQVSFYDPKKGEMVALIVYDGSRDGHFGGSDVGDKFVMKYEAEKEDPCKTGGREVIIEVVNRSPDAGRTFNFRETLPSISFRTDNPEIRNNRSMGDKEKAGILIKERDCILDRALEIKHKLKPGSEMIW